MPRRVYPLLVLGLLGFAACGEDAPSKQEFLAKADPVCKRGNDIAAVFTTPSDIPMMKDFTTKLADNATKTADEVAKLDKPGGDDGKAAEELVEAMKAAAESARAVGPEVDKNSYSAIEAAVSKAVEAFNAADAKARALGSAECGKGEAAAAQKLGQTAPATVKNAFITEADKLCAAANKEIEAIAEPEDFPDVKPYLDRTVGIAEKLNADIKAKPAPTLDNPKLVDAIAANDAAIAKIKEAQAAAAAGEQRKTFQLLDETIALSDTANAKADAYGFKDCGSQGA